MLTAVTMVRNEADIIGFTVGWLFEQGVDHVIVADNLSTDDTRDVLGGFPVEIVDDPDPAYRQAEKMTRLAELAAERGADWIVPFDADEAWLVPGCTLGDYFADPPPADVVGCVGYDHIVTVNDDPDVPDPLARIGHRRTTPQSLPKVAFRPHPRMRLHYGNHNVDWPEARRITELELRHYQYRSFRQMSDKVRHGARALELAKLHPQYGTHWRDAAGLPDMLLESMWDQLCSEQGLVWDPLR